MLDHACIDAFKVAVHAPGNHWTKRQHKDFRELLFQELFKFQAKGEAARHLATLGDERLNPQIQYIWLQLSSTRQACA